MALGPALGPSGPYHLVWSRDLYQIATGLIAAGDTAGANRALDWLFDTQQKPDGSFPQNSKPDGTPVWTGLQMDEVAFPMILAHQLGRTDAGTWAHVKRAADFLLSTTGTRTPATPRRGRRWSAGRTRPATRRRRSRRRSRASSAPRRSRGPTATTRQRDQVPQHGRRVAGQGQGLDVDDDRPVPRAAVLPAVDQGRQPGRRARPTRPATAARPRPTSARSSTRRSWTSSASASCPRRPRHRQHRAGRRSSSSASRPRAGSSGTARSSTATASSATARRGTSTRRRTPGRRSAARGRCSTASAARRRSRPATRPARRRS